MGSEGFKNLSKAARDLLHHMQKIDGDYYPELLWNTVKGRLDPKTTAKIHVLGSKYHNKLLEAIDSSQLPDFLGGSCSCANEGGCLRSNRGPWNDPTIMKLARSLEATFVRQIRRASDGEQKGDSCTRLRPLKGRSSGASTAESGSDVDDIGSPLASGNTQYTRLAPVHEEKLDQALKAGAISYHSLLGRHKSLFSIYSKMLKKKLDMDEIHDIHGLRLIVETEEDCYKALRVVQQLWHEVPDRFKDYIVDPKCNGYQSLHTVVICEGTVPLEIQIRTKKMHLQAGYGFAAHWRYKEGDCKYSNFVLQMVEWAQWVITWQCEAMNKDRSSVGFFDSVKPPCVFPTHYKDCTFSCKPRCGPDGPVFIIMIENDKMSVQEFPVNSTLVDLLETASQGGSRWAFNGFPVKEELRPRLNHKPISDPTCKLKMGDVVELTPTLPDKSLTEYREEIQRMYNKGLTVSSAVSSCRS